jgi:ankyrin repeat protein
VNAPLVENVTNAICRSAFLGYKNIASLLLRHGADINLRSSDGRTPLIWAAFRNNHDIVAFLLDNGAQLDLEDNMGWNALDVAIIRMNYESALILRNRGLVPRDKDMYAK